MGREIRRVPPNWQHPKKEVADYLTMKMVERYQPLYDHPFGPAMDEWYADWKAWERGEHPEYADLKDRNLQFWEWSGSPPDPEYYRPDWKPEEMTWFQIYETVSEGTPVSPPFATKEELVDYLVTHGDLWDQKRTKEGRQQSAPWDRPAAEQFVGAGWAMSGLMVAREMYAPRDGDPLGKNEHLSTTGEKQ